VSNKYLLPQELARPPIEEATFELRFKPLIGDKAEGLPAFLRAELTEAYPRSESIPLSTAPAQFRKTQEETRYQPRIRQFGPLAAFMVGDQAVWLRLVAPYPGWDEVRDRIEQLTDVLKKSKMVGAVERISLKFVNVLRELPDRQLEGLRVDVRVNGEHAPEAGMHLRMEFNDETYSRVVELQPNPTGPFIDPNPDATGLTLSLECRRQLGIDDDFWTDRDAMIENLHFELRALFFRILRQASVEKLGPIYRAEPERE
jgi:uncharacterized protein (TIGR04255 family)